MRRRSLFLLALLAGTVGIALVGAARAEPPTHQIHAAGAVDPSVGFTSFHLSASLRDGTSAGRAAFDDVTVAGGRLVVEVTCVRVVTDVDSVDQSTRLVAILTGPVVAAANGIGLGRQAIIGVVDGDQSTPTPTPDAINADFALEDLPSSITCENAGLAIEAPLLRGGVQIR